MLGNPNVFLKMDTFKPIVFVNNMMERKIREAIEIEKHPQNVNRDKGYLLNTTWCPVVYNCCINHNMYQH